jgi:hydroxyacylglutathione hydrolase
MAAAAAAAASAGGSGAGALQIERVPCLSDNYSWLLHEPQAGVTAVVDPAEVAPVVAALQAKGWTLTHIINSERPRACGEWPDRLPACSLPSDGWLDQLPAHAAGNPSLPSHPPPCPPACPVAHHHWDHVGGNEALKQQFNCTVVGPTADAARIPGIDVQLKDGER